MAGRASAEPAASAAAIAAVFDPQRMFDHPDPYPVFAAMRAAAPVVRIGRSGGPQWAITREADVRRVLEDAAGWIQPSIGRVVFGQSRGARAERHARVRAVAARVFTATASERWEPVIAAAAERLLDGLDGTPVDLGDAYARRLPVMVLGELLGIPERERAGVLERSHEIIGLARAPERGTAAAQALDRLFAPLVGSRRRAPGDDVLSRLLATTSHGQGLSDAELVAFLRILIPAAVDPPADMLGNLLVALLGVPARWARVVGDRRLVPAAIDEALRWEAPIVFVVRQPTQAVALGDVTIPAGVDCAVVIGSANRDERHWVEPDRFDLDRPPAPHLAFAHGRHFCLGRSLAEQIGRIGLRTLCERLPRLRLSAEHRSPTIRGAAFRRATAIMVRWD